MIRMSRLDDLLNNAKLNELIHKNKVEEERKGRIIWVLAVIGAIASVATIAYIVYRYFGCRYLNDFDGDFDYDELDDDFDFDEEDDIEKKPKNTDE